jgi:hypothetical protein
VTLTGDDRPMTSLITTKRVLFSDDVDVCEFPYSTVDGDCSPTEGQLGSDVQFTDFSPSAGYDTCHYDPVELWQVFPEFSEHRRPQPPSRHTVHVARQEKPVQYRIVSDRLRGDFLLISLSLGTDYDPQSVMVRANASGRRVGVVACKNRQKTGEQQLKQQQRDRNNRNWPNSNDSVKVEYSSRLTLPVAVDSSRLEARVDALGNLKIEAAIL